MNYPVTIHHIFISEGHSYFGQPKGKPAEIPTFDVDEVKAIAGAGLQGDRFYNIRPDFDGQITFFSLEVFQGMSAELGLVDFSPLALRRNVIIEGVPLNQLIGQAFTIDFGENAIDFFGARHCHPCRWMDVAAGAGALKFLKGRGGLRAQILSDGIIRKGIANLSTEVDFDLDSVSEPLTRPNLP